MSLASDTLEWLDAYAAHVAEHPGAAYPETEILRMLVTGTGPQSSDLFAEAYRRDIARRLPPCQTRAEARAFAHYVMFAGSFGRAGAVEIAEGADEAIDAALVAHADDTDTLGELLIAAHIVGHFSPITIASRALFDTAWSAIPRDVFDHYHVILVGGILYALTGH